MAYNRGDVVLIPFPFSDLSAAKTRPAVIVSSPVYHRVRPELLLAYVSSQVTKADPVLDYVLADWAAAGLPKPSFVRPKIAAVEPKLIVHTVGKLTVDDMFEVDRRLWQAIGLTHATVKLLINHVDLSIQPPALLQTLAEKSIAALLTWENTQTASIDISRLRTLLASGMDIDPLA